MWAQRVGQHALLLNIENYSWSVYFSEIDVENLNSLCLYNFYSLSVLVKIKILKINI